MAPFYLLTLLPRLIEYMAWSKEGKHDYIDIGVCACMCRP